MDRIALVLRSYLENPLLSQRQLAELLHLSLGSAHKLFAQAQEKGLLAEARSASPASGEASGFSPTKQGMAYLAPYRMDRAVIFAAGFGSRFVPLTFETPKGLVEVLGERMIERQIRQLHAAGITDITIVVGYLKEKFEYLIDLFGVKLLYNPEYREKNTLATLYHARHLLEGANTYLLVSDNWLRSQMYHAYECGSWYSASYMAGDTSEWCLSINKKERITDIHIGGRDSWAMYGPACLMKDFSADFIPLLEKAYHTPGTEQNYWENVLMPHLDTLPLYANLQPAGQVYEFENLEELRAFDPRYRSQSDNQAMELVSRVFRVPESDITDIHCLKSGMTNQSFLFTVKNRRYICRIPGPGTDKLINRRQEAAVYRAVAPLKITEDVIYLDENTGYKISAYYEGAANADFSDPRSETVSRCLNLLRGLHVSGIKVDHSFSLRERIDFYESLCHGRQRELFEDYPQVRKRIDHLMTLLEQMAHRPRVLAHIDPVCDNFLMLPDGGIRLIDWEYAGMQDPLVDIAMMAIYSYYDREQTLALLANYLQREPEREEVFVTFAYAALGGFLWMLWSVYKSMSGIEFGEYIILMYRYAKEYSKIPANADKEGGEG